MLYVHSIANDRKLAYHDLYLYTFVQLKDCESIIKILESEIASKSPAIETHRQTTSASIEALTGTFAKWKQKGIIL